MGSFFGNIGNAIKKGVVDTGHLVGKVASNPLVEGAAGLVGGPALAAAVGGIGHLIAPGGNLGTAVKGAVTGGLAGVAGGAIKSGVGAIADNGFENWAKSQLSNGGSGLAAIGQKLGITGGAPGGVSGVPSVGGIPGVSSASDLVSKLLLGGSVAAGAADKVHQTDTQNKAMGYVTGAYDEKAPLRAQAIAGLQNTAAPDLSSIFSSPGSVYDRQRRGMAPLGPRVPAAPMPATSPAALPAASPMRIMAGA